MSNTPAGSPSSTTTTPSSTTTTPTTTTTTPTAATTDYAFNITLGIGNDNKPVTVGAADLANVKKNGLHFHLPADTPVALGTLSDFIAWVNTKFGLSIPDTSADFDGWPGPLATAFEDVLTATVTIEKLDIDQAGLPDPTKPSGTGNEYPPMTFDISVTGTATKPVSIVDGLLSIIGAGVSLTRTGGTTT